MNVVPIKVETITPTKYKFVEWMLHNVCNHNCSFCGQDIKDGSKRWLTIDQYKTYADKIIDLCKGQPFWMQFTGGEPTLFPELLDLLNYVKSKGAYVSLISNGTRTIRWWEELKQKKCLDNLFITYHSEQTNDYKHIVDVLNLFQLEDVKTTCLITHSYGSIEQAIEAREYIERHTGSTILFKAMMIGDYDIYSLYNENQTNEVKKSWSYGVNASSKKPPSFPNEHKLEGLMKIIHSDRTIKIADTQELMKNKQNVFFDWNCDIGINTMRIVVDKVYRGQCGVGGLQYDLSQDIKFSDNSIKCTKEHCSCTVDLVTTKTK